VAGAGDAGFGAEVGDGNVAWGHQLMGVGFKPGVYHGIHAIFLQNSICIVERISCFTVARCFIKIDRCSVKLFGKITLDSFF
jgi:hypothetical protein